MDRPDDEIVVIDEIEPIASIARSWVAVKQLVLLLGSWGMAFFVAIVRPTWLYVSLPFGAIAIGYSLVLVRRLLIEFARAVRT